MRRLLIPTILLLAAAIPLAALGRAEAPAEARILYVPGVADPFYYALERGARTRAEELGAGFSVSAYPERWEAPEQIAVLKQAVAAGDYDLVMIAPVANDALIAPLAAVHAAGIEIITVDTKIGDGNYRTPGEWSFPLVHIGTDNVDGGIRLAEYIAEQVGEKGSIYINTTTPDTSTTEERKDGFLEGIARFPEMEVVGIDYNGDLQEVAARQTLTALQEYPDLVAIFGTNVFSSQGVSSSVTRTGLSGAVRVAAWDATEELITSLRNGEVDVVLAQKPEEIGSLAVEWAWRFLTEGRQIPPAVTSGYVLFTPSNVDSPGMAQYVYSD